MEQALIAGGFALFGVFLGGAVQYFLFRQKYRAEARDRILEHQMRFASDVFLYLRLIRNLREAEHANEGKGKPVAVPEDSRADVSARYRAVVASAHALMVSEDVKLVGLAESFLKTFTTYVDAHRHMSTGRGGEYPRATAVEEAADEIRKHKPKPSR